MTKYHPQKESSLVSVQIRGLNYAIHTWGDPSRRPLFLLHGWADCGHSFQFLAESMPSDYYLIAPDWRGFGETEWSEQGYWFPDYLADLDAILEFFSANEPVLLVGHSMGGNVACLYAGVKPERVSVLVSLDVFGLPETNPDDAVDRYALWLEQLKETPRFTEYTDLEQLCRHIKKLAPQISEPHARFIAKCWSRKLDSGKYTVKADPAHKNVNPVLYRREEAKSCWKKIAAPTLFLFGEHSKLLQSYIENDYQQDCHDSFKDLREEIIPNSGHMIHLEQPFKLAELICRFIDETS